MPSEFITGLMNDPPRISTWKDLYALPRFQARIDPKVVKLAAAIWPYAINEKMMQPCSLSNCGTKHLHGLIVALDDDTITGIGRDCGGKYFPNWEAVFGELAIRKSIVERRILVETLATQAKQLSSALDALRDRMAVHQTLRKSLDSIPSLVLDELERRTRNNELTIIGWRDRSDAEYERDLFYDENLKREAQIRDAVATLTATKFLDPRYDPPRIARFEIQPALRKAAYLDALKPNELNQIGRELTNSISALKRMEAGLLDSETFLSPENLRAILRLPIAKKVALQGLAADAGRVIVKKAFRPPPPQGRW